MRGNYGNERDRRHDPLVRRAKSGRDALRLAPLLLLGFAAGAAGQGYFTVDVGGAAARDLLVAVSGVNHPTRCDTLLYANPADAPRDEACTASTPQELFRSLFRPGAGFALGGAVGYRMGALRLELSVMSAGAGDDQRLIATASGNDSALISKDSEWDPDDPPSETFSEVRVRRGFANAILDLSNPSPFTPYLGAGVGLGRVEARYAARWVRRADLGPAEWQRNAAGTTSLLDTRLRELRVGVQAFAGIGFSLGGAAALDLRAHWSRFTGFTAAEQLWRQIRDHEPVQADGATPFTTDVAVGDLDRLGLTLGMRYSF